MNELLEFAARVIELEGGAIESSPSGISALLPAGLGAAWNVREELALSELETEGAVRFGYGVELLERVIETATRELPVVRGRVVSAPLRMSQVRSAAAHWTLRNGVVDVGEVRACPARRLWLDALVTLHGDEKRELLTSAVISADSGALVEGFEPLAGPLSSTPVAARSIVAEPALQTAFHFCMRRGEGLGDSFRAAMTRRFERDCQRIEGYFQDLLDELARRAARGRLEPTTVADKRRALLADRAVKLDALAARFVLRIEVRPVALRDLELDGAFVTMTLRRRKASRTIELEYDLVTRRLVPVRCDGCAGTAPRPAACDDAVHLLCEVCAPRADGRIACPACKKKSVRASAPDALSARL